MKTAGQLRKDFTKTIAHIRAAFGKVRGNSGPRNILSAPDLHKISEGLFLSAVAHWEEFCQELLISDLALQTSSHLAKNIRSFKSNAARDRVAYLITSHLDHPNGFYDWSEFGKVHSRAAALLGIPNRFNIVVPPKPPGVDSKNTPSLPNATISELTDFKIIRNAIAHKNDKAWDAFMRLVVRAPYGLTVGQKRGITPGRFVSSHNISGIPILDHTLNTLDAAALVLVP